MQVPLQRPLHAHAMFDVALHCGSDLVQRRLMQMRALTASRVRKDSVRDVVRIALSESTWSSLMMFERLAPHLPRRLPFCALQEQGG
jgi:hypothetical protein